MYIVYELDNGELIYTSDAEALQHLNSEVYAWVKVEDDWSDTHFWNRDTRSLEPIPSEE